LALEKWVQYKINAPIAPFQKLKFLDPTVFTLPALSQLTPVLIGKSIRKRIHIYIDRNDSNNRFNKIPKNSIPKNELPSFFSQNEMFEWVLESSLDHSIFYPVHENKPTEIKISEFEVEIKYRINNLKSEIMTVFDAELLKNFKLTPQLASKYKQVIKNF